MEAQGIGTFLEKPSVWNLQSLSNNHGAYRRYLHPCLNRSTLHNYVNEKMHGKAINKIRRNSSILNIYNTRSFINLLTCNTVAILCGQESMQIYVRGDSVKTGRTKYAGELINVHNISLKQQNYVENQEPV